MITNQPIAAIFERLGRKKMIADLAGISRTTMDGKAEKDRYWEMIKNLTSK